MASKVYFADFRCPSWRENLQQKLARLMMTAGFGDIDMDGKYVAIKMNFGEPGNMAYLRPNWAKTVADLVKSQGGKPFLTDCNTLYIGGRKNALDHMESAYVNGFTPYSTGCPKVFAELKGGFFQKPPCGGADRLARCFGCTRQTFRQQSPKSFCGSQEGAFFKNRLAAGLIG